MALSHSYYPDARQSTFNDVRGSQTNESYNITIISSAPDRILHQLLPKLDDVVQKSTPSPGGLSQRITYQFEANSAGDIAIGLIIEIMQLLISQRQFSDNHRDLELELESLYQSLILAGLAIQSYQYSPLGRHLANTITPEMKQCRVVLQELLNKVSATRQSFDSTCISNLWYRIWRSRWEESELVSFRLRLSESRRALEAFLKALNSYVGFSRIVTY